MTPEQRALRARIASNARWSQASKADRTAGTATARRVRREQWAAEVDPDGELPPDELARRVANKQAEHMARMTLASSRARASRKTA